MELFEQIKTRRSIRKFEKKAIEKEKLDKIIEAGLYAPNPGGRQATKIIMVNDPTLIERIGIVNANCENRNWSTGVNAEQPSIIDDLTIKSGFYGCQSLAMVCVPRKNATAVNVVGGAFCVAENMVLEAFDLDISSCIVGRGLATFEKEEMNELLKMWNFDEEYIPIVFVCLGYIQGPYPKAKPRKENRVYVID